MKVIQRFIDFSITMFPVALLIQAKREMKFEWYIHYALSTDLFWRILPVMLLFLLIDSESSPTFSVPFHGTIRSPAYAVKKYII